MKKQNIQDERVVAERRKISSDAFGILMIALLASILVQQFFLKASFEHYAVEFICFFGMCVYIIARHMMLGINIYGEGKRVKASIVLNSIVTGLVVTAVNGVLNYTKYAERYREDGMGYFIAVLGVTFISASIMVFAIHLFLHYLNKKRQEKIQKQLDSDE